MSPNIASRIAIPSHSSSSFPPRRAQRLRPPRPPPSPPRSTSPDVRLALAQKSSPTPAEISSAKVALFRAELDAAQCKFRRLLSEARSIADGCLLRACPSHTGPTDYDESAVPAATQESTRKDLSDQNFPRKCTNKFIGGRSPKPAMKSILKPSIPTMIGGKPPKPIPACAGLIDNSGDQDLCEASAEVYAAPWRTFPAQEWAIDKLPIERLDRCVLLHQQIKKRKLLAGGARPRSVKFAQPVVSGCRIVSRWIAVPK